MASEGKGVGGEIRERRRRNKKMSVNSETSVAQQCRAEAKHLRREYLQLHDNRTTEWEMEKKQWKGGEERQQSGTVHKDTRWS